MNDNHKAHYQGMIRQVGDDNTRAMLNVFLREIDKVHYQVACTNKELDRLRRQLNSMLSSKGKDD